MVQRKISAFFKHPTAKIGEDDDGLVPDEKRDHAIGETFEPGAPASNGGNEIDGGNRASMEEIVNKKRMRSYAQVHLELGQRDFLLRTCSVCGTKYAPGNDLDEKSHTRFRKNYTHGLPFKGWCNERVVAMPLIEGGGRVVLVLGYDPRPRRNKVLEVVEMMESELGSGWIYHKLCKVYLFIASGRIAGSLFAEPITVAFKFIPRAERGKPNSSTTKAARKAPPTLRFGNAIFQREAVTRAPPLAKDEALDEDLMGAVYCEEEAVPADWYQSRLGHPVQPKKAYCQSLT